MEVYLAIAPQDLLMVLDVPQSKPKGAGVATSFIVLTTSVPVPATTQSTFAASTLPRVTRAASKKGIYPCFFSFLSFCLFYFYFYNAS